MITQITDFINSYSNKEVVWGDDDCTAWAAKWSEVATGNPIKLPDYNCREQANQIIDDAGGLVELINNYLGFSEVFGDPSIGDIAVIETERSGLVTVIVLNNGVAAWRGDKGVRLFRVRPRYIKAYWKINAK